MSYELIKIKTIESETGGLSFFEGEHDIPFSIKHLYCIYESDCESENKFSNQMLLFCPYGEVQIVLDNDGTEEAVELSERSKGLFLQKSFWKRIVWKQAGSILCVAASETIN